MKKEKPRASLPRTFQFWRTLGTIDLIARKRESRWPREGQGRQEEASDAGNVFSRGEEDQGLKQRAGSKHRMRQTEEN